MTTANGSTVGERGRRIGLGVLVASLVAMCVPVLVPNVASAAPLLSRIVGYVDTTGDLRVEGIDVEVSTYAGVVVDTDVTGLAGEFSIDVTETPADGNGYTVTFTDPDDFYGKQVYPQLYVQPGYDELLSARMVEGGRVAGVIRVNAVPVPNVCIDISRPTYYASADYGQVCSGPDGTYQSEKLDPGTYDLYVAGTSMFAYANDTAAITSGTTATVDFDLVPFAGGSASVAGSVVSASGGSGVSACVSIYSSTAPTSFYGCTDLNGVFSIPSLAPGSYTAYAGPNDGLHIAPASSTIELVAGVNNVQLVVPLGATISGTVTTADGVTPLAGVRVEACLFSCYTSSPYAITDAAGQYTIRGLNTIGYNVRFSRASNNTQWWDGTPAVNESPTSATAVVFPTPLGSSQTGIDARMSAKPVGSISGTVTDSVSLLPIVNGTVRIRPFGTYGATVAAVPTDANGNFVIPDLDPGQYQVSVASIGYVSERYSDAKNGTTLPSPVVVVGGSPTPGINFALDPQGVIEGTVGFDEPPVSFGDSDTYCVTATPANAAFAPVETCRPFGSAYRLSKLPAGTYSVTVTSYDYLDQTVSPVVVGVEVGGAAVEQNFVLQRVAIISGTVRDASSAPVANAYVCALDETGDGPCANGGADGTYRLAAHPGQYQVYAQAFGFQNEWYPELSAAPAVPNVAVGAADLVDVDFTLAPRPKITVVATVDGGTTPACALETRVLNSVSQLQVGYMPQTNCTATPGVATATTFVDPGTYKLQFGNASFGNFVPEYWQDQATFAAGQTVTLASGDDVTFNVSVAMKPAITGTVTSTAPGNAPLANVFVAAYVDGPTQGSYVAYAYTQANGTYNLPVAAGNYRLFFSRGQFGTEWWDNAPSFATATTIAVSGATVANASLQPMTLVSGTITVDGAPATPVQGVSVRFWQGNSAVSPLTASNGTFSAYLLPGTYEVEFYSPTHRSEWYDETTSRATSTPFVVGSSPVVLNESLVALRTISGTVVADGTSTPISGINVQALFGSGAFAASAVTNAAGQYTLGVESAEFVILFNGQQTGYVSEYYQDQSTFSSAALVDVRDSSQVVNGALALGGSISGTMLDGDGAPVLNCAYAYPRGNPLAPYTGYGCTSSTSGAFMIRGLPAGSYDVSTYIGGWRWYNGVDTRAAATPVAVTVGAVTSGINFVVGAGSITGFVVDELDQPIQGAQVSASGPGGSQSDATDANGFFELDGLADDDGYQVSISAAGYVSEYFDDARTWANRELVAVDGAAVALGMIELAPLSVTVSGDVEIAGSLAPAEGVCLDFAELNGFNYSTCTDTGSYSIELPSNGDFSVRVRDNSPAIPYVEANPYPYGSPLAIGVVDLVEDFEIEVGYQIRGRAVLEGTTVGLPGIQVTVTDSMTGFWVANAFTDQQGNYNTTALQNGLYSVRFSNPSGRYIAEYNGETYSSPGELVVVADADVVDINAELAAGALIVGIVSDEAGDPVPSACVTARLVGQPDVLSSSCTNAEGVYTTSGLPNGNIELSVNLFGYQPFEQVVAIANGEDEVLNIELAAPLTSVSGVIRVSGTGDPISGACVSIGGVPPLATQCVGPTGEFEFLELAPGTYSLTLSAAGYDPTTAFVYPAVGSPWVEDVFLTPLQLPLLRFEESNPALVFSSGWSVLVNALRSGGSSVGATAAGSSVSFRFEGSAVRWLATTGPNRGIASVVIDGGPPVEVDLYDSTYRYQQVVFERFDVGPGSHSVTITPSGTRNSAATGGWFDVDAIEAAGLQLPLLRFEESNPALVFSSGWSVLVNALRSGGSSVGATAAGSSVSFRFEGSAVRWLATTGPNRGIASVVIDGGPPVEVDLYDSTYRYQQVVFERFDVGPGSHSVTITPSGTRNSAATGGWFDVDAIEAAGLQLPLLRFEESNPALVFSSGWSVLVNALRSGGSSVGATAAGSSVSFRFEGSAVRWLATTGPNRGIASVVIDGGPPVEVDLYDSTYRYQQVVFERFDVGPGSHSVTITPSGTRNSAATGGWFDVDAIEAAGLQLPLLRFEESNPALVFSSGWSVLVNALRSGGSSVGATAAGSSVSFRFEGSAVRWLATTGPNRGIASVVIDGGPPVEVDLYDSTYRYQQVVFERFDVGPGSHSVTITPSGTRNSAATGGWFDVDAIEAAGLQLPL